jgi:hypothetical protein
MSELPTSNTDKVTVSDRAASGQQPDNTPATGGGPTGGGGGGGGGVTSITGTPKQIIASASTGAVNLSTPQDIDPTADVTFDSMTLTGLGLVNNGPTKLKPTAIVSPAPVMDFGSHTYFSGQITANTVMGAANYGAGELVIIDLTSAGNFVLAWPAGWNWGTSGPPLQILTGMQMRVWCMVGSTFASGVKALYSFSSVAGDLSGALPNPKVIALQGVPVDPTPPSPGQVLTDVGGVWVGQPIPTATSSTLGIVKPDNTTVTISGAGVLSAVGGGSGAVPVGGTKFQRLAKKSATNYDTAWYSQPFFNLADYASLAGGGPNNQALAAANVTAFGNAVADAIAAGGGTIYVPDGYWWMNATLSFATTLHLGVIGNTMNTSTLGWTGVAPGTDGLKLDSSGADTGFVVRDLGFQLDGGVAGGNACWLIPGPTANQNQCIAQNLRFAGGDGWTNGVYIPCPGGGIFSGTINNIFGYGGFYDDSPSPPGSGLNNKSTGSLIYIENPINASIGDWSSFGFQTGLTIQAVNGTGLSTFQGINISRFIVNAAKKGIRLLSVPGLTTMSGAIQISDGVIDLGNFPDIVGGIAVEATYVNEITIHDVYCIVNGTTPQGFVFGNGNHHIIHDCHLFSGSGPNGIALEAAPYSDVHDNTFSGWTTADVNFNPNGHANTSSCTMHHNTDLGPANALATYVDYGGSNNRIGTSVP